MPRAASITDAELSFAAAGEDALALTCDADCADCLGVAVEDRGRDAALAEHCFFFLEGVAAARTSSSSRFGAAAVTGVWPVSLAGSAPTRSTSTSGIQCHEDSLAERGRVQGQQRSHFEDLEARVGAEDVVHEHPVAVEGAYRTASSASGQRLRVGERARAQLAQIEVAVGELEELWAELVLVAVGVLFDQTVGCERPQSCTVPLASPRRSESSLTPSRPGPVASALRMLIARSTDWIIGRYCRTVFDIVEWLAHGR